MEQNLAQAEKECQEQGEGDMHPTLPGSSVTPYLALLSVFSKCFNEHFHSLLGKDFTLNLDRQ